MSTDVVSVSLQGGLGNQLFQLAAAIKLAQNTGREVCIDAKHVNHKNPHSKQNYFSTIFKNVKCITSNNVWITLEEDSSWTEVSLADSSKNHLYGYFQHIRYVPDNFMDYLSFPVVNHKETHIFLSIRGGDYIKNRHHQIQDDLLYKYYEVCLEQVPLDIHILVCTNDRKYAKQFEKLFSGRSFSYDDSKDEVACMASMAACTYGGILTNSSYSWWSSYFGHHKWPDAKYWAPSPWFPRGSQYYEKLPTDGIYSEWIQKINI